MKYVYLEQGDIVYTLGGGLGSWAKSREEKLIEHGTTRVIGGILMYAYTINRISTIFRIYEINWCPVDRELCHDWDKMVNWKNNL